MKPTTCFPAPVAVSLIRVLLLIVFMHWQAEASDGVRVKSHSKGLSWTNGMMALDHVANGQTMNLGYSNVFSGSTVVSLIRGSVSSSSGNIKHVWSDGGISKAECFQWLHPGNGSVEETSTSSWSNSEGAGVRISSRTAVDSIHGDTSYGPLTNAIGPADWPATTAWVMRRETIPGSSSTNRVCDYEEPGGEGECCGGCCEGGSGCSGGSTGSPPGYPYLEWTSDMLVTERVESELVAHGTNSANMVPYLLHVWATNIFAGEPIPPETMTVLGQTPDTNGYVLVLVPEGSTNDVTPTIPSINFNEDHYVHYRVGYASSKLLIVQVNRQDGEGHDRDLTDRHWVNWTGERVVAEARIQGQDLWAEAGYTMTTNSVQWTVAQHPATFGNYDPGASSNQLAPTFSLNLHDVSFCWLQPSSSRTLAAGAGITITGPGVNISKSASASCTFEVKRPEGVELSAIIPRAPHVDYGTIYGNTRTWLTLAELHPETPEADDEHGFIGQVNHPENIGQWGICQVVNLRDVIMYASGDGVTNQFTSLDQGFPYPFLEEVEPNAFKYVDSPSSPLPQGWMSYYRRDDMTNWLMFMPSGQDSCWVPVRQMQWWWWGNAYWSVVVTTNGGWAAGSGDKADNIQSVETVDHPVWNSIR
jgi:hypothetical protein